MKKALWGAMFKKRIGVFINMGSLLGTLVIGVLSNLAGANGVFLGLFNSVGVDVGSGVFFLMFVARGFF